MRITGTNKINFMGRVLLVLVPLCMFNILMSGKTELEKFYGRWTGTPPDALVEQGATAIKHGDMELALMFFNMAIRNYDKDAPDSEQRSYVQAYLNAGSIFYSEYSDNQQAYNCFMNALEINRRLGVAGYEEYLYANIGNIYIDLNDNDSAMSYYFKAMSGSLSRRNWYVASVVASNIFFHAVKSKQLHGCSGLPGMLDKVRIPDNDPNGRYLNIYRRVLRAMLAGRYGDAVSGLDDMIEVADKSVYEDPVLLIVMLRESKAYVYSYLGLYDKGVEECVICERLIQQNNINKSELKEVYEVMSQLLYSKGDVSLAYTYLKKAGSCMAGMETKARNSKVSAMKSMYKLDKQNAEMDVLTREGNLRNLVMAVLAVALAGLAVLLVVMYRHGRKLKHKNRLIYIRTMKLLDESKADYRRIMEYENRIAACNAEIDSLKSSAAGHSCAETEADGKENTGADVPEDKEFAAGSAPDAAMLNIMSKVFEVMEDGSDIFLPDFSIDKLAAAIGSKPKYVSQAINSCCKKNFRTILSEYRIREVCRRFSEKDKYGDYTIEAIAMSVGFNSRSVFIAAFKRIMGITPSEYMKTGLVHKA